MAAGAAASGPLVADQIATLSPSCSYAPSTQGYLQATAQGDVLASGEARLYGTLMDRTINEPVVGLAGTPTGNGYWEAAADGGVFAFGDAGFHGSMGGTRLNQPIVGMAARPDGGGYWLTAADGGVFAFGDAGFHGSMGGTRLNQPIVGMAATPDGGGYWLTAADGGVFAFGDAGFHGSMGGTPLAGKVAGLASTPSGSGYWLTGADGGIFAFGDATFQGSFAGGLLPSQVIGIVSYPSTATAGSPVQVQSSGTSTFQDGADYYYAGAGQVVTAAGASVQMCAASPGTPSWDPHTLTELAVTLDPSGLNYIEIGWEASSAEYGDLAPHLFVDRWNNGVPANCGLFDNQSCGFVEVSTSLWPNMDVPIGITASYAVEHLGQQWNLYFDGQLLGYFPDSLWNDAYASTNYLQVFGEVATRPGVTPSIIMGNGLYGHDPGADRVTGYQLLGPGAAPAAFQWASDSVAASYDIVATQTSFAYGGPGGSRGQSGPQIEPGGEPRLPPVSLENSSHP